MTKLSKIFGKKIQTNNSVCSKKLISKIYENNIFNDKESAAGILMDLRLYTDHQLLMEKYGFSEVWHKNWFRFLINSNNDKRKCHRTDVWLKTNKGKKFCKVRYWDHYCSYFIPTATRNLNLIFTKDTSAIARTQKETSLLNTLENKIAVYYYYFIASVVSSNLGSKFRVINIYW